MDALGIALSLATSAGMHILSAGEDVAAPSSATVAIICSRPSVTVAYPSPLILEEQVYVVSKGKTCKYTYLNRAGSLDANTWSWGDSMHGLMIIYLG